LEGTLSSSRPDGRDARTAPAVDWSSPLNVYPNLDAAREQAATALAAKILSHL
jgi:hypothetical protein